MEWMNGLDEDLMIHSEEGDLHLVKNLIKKGARQHFDEYWAFVSSATNGHLPVVEFLLENGADIHANEDSALTGSSSGGHLDIVKHLISKGASIHARNDYALRLSLTNKHYEIAEFLLLKINKKEYFERWIDDLPKNIQVRIKLRLLTMKL